MLLCTAATCPALAFPYSLQRPRIRLALLIAPVTPQPSQELRWSWCQLPAVVLPWLRPPWHLCQPRQMRKQKMDTVCRMIVCVCVCGGQIIFTHSQSTTVTFLFVSVSLCLSRSLSHLSFCDIARVSACVCFFCSFILIMWWCVCTLNVFVIFFYKYLY